MASQDSAALAYRDASAPDHRIRRRALLAALAVACASVLPGGSAHARAPMTHVHCGQTLTQSVRLANDLVDCPRQGLVIGADAITVDLDGHTIDGTVADASCAPPTDPHLGIDNTAGFDRTSVANGTIREFEFGVMAGSDAAGMSTSRIHHLTLSHNGDGVFVGSGAGPAATAGNRIDHNVVAASGCSGIALNTGQRNRIDANRVDGAQFAISVCCGTSDDANAVADNAVADASIIGILVFSSGAGRVTDNAVSDIGELGILINGDQTIDELVAGNAVARTQGPGVSVESCCDQGPRLQPTDVHVIANTLMATGEGIVLFESDHNEVRANTVTGPGTFGPPDNIGFGVIVDSASGELVTDNTVIGPRGPGILVGLPEDIAPTTRPVTDNTIDRNHVIAGATDGLLVLDFAHGTALARNRAERNAADGIHVLSPTSTLAANVADDNGALGIEAVAGVIDGGANRAAGNGDPAQCTGVTCRTGGGEPTGTPPVLQPPLLRAAAPHLHHTPADRARMGATAQWSSHLPRGGQPAFAPHPGRAPRPRPADRTRTQHRRARPTPGRIRGWGARGPALGRMTENNHVPAAP